MKRELSVLMLVARSSIYKFLTVLILMSVSQISFFYMTARKYDLQGQGTASLERIIEEGYIQQIFYIAFLLMCIILAWAESGKGSRLEYTLKRLGISRERVFFLQVGYHICCFFILFAVQIFVVIGIGSLYLKWMEEIYVSSQSLFLAFWRNEFLHSLLPLAEISRWVRNGVLIVFVGLEITFFGTEEQQSRRLPLVWCSMLVILIFSDPAGYWQADLVKGGILLMFIFLILAGERMRLRQFS